MIDAKEARIMAMNLNLFNDEKEKVDNFIKEVAKNGETKCLYEGNLLDSTIKELENKGYKVIPLYDAYPKKYNLVYIDFTDAIDSESIPDLFDIKQNVEKESDLIVGDDFEFGGSIDNFKDLDDFKDLSGFKLDDFEELNKKENQKIDKNKERKSNKNINKNINTEEKIENIKEETYNEIIADYSIPDDDEEEEIKIDLDTEKRNEVKRKYQNHCEKLIDENYHMFHGEWFQDGEEYASVSGWTQMLFTDLAYLRYKLKLIADINDYYEKNLEILVNQYGGTNYQEKYFYLNGFILAFIEDKNMDINKIEKIIDDSIKSKYLREDQDLFSSKMREIVRRKNYR